MPTIGTLQEVNDVRSDGGTFACNNDGNSVLAVLVQSFDSGPVAPTVTWDGVSMTARYNASTSLNSSWYTLDAPTTGAANLVIAGFTNKRHRVWFVPINDGAFKSSSGTVSGAATSATTGAITTAVGDLVLAGLTIAAAADPTVVATGDAVEHNEGVICVSSAAGWGWCANFTADDTAATMSATWTGSVLNHISYLVLEAAVAGDTAALTGTAASGQTEQRMRTGGNTIIGTLTGDTWTATFDATVQDALTAGLDSAQAEAGGWNATVRDAATNPITWVRTSDTIATGTLAAVSAYQITATETITFTIPASALTGGVAIVASPTFTVTRGAMDLVQPVGVTNASGVPTTSSGSLTGDVAQLTRVTCTIDGVTLDTVRVITSR